MALHNNVRRKKKLGKPQQQIHFKSDGQEISTIEWQELKNLLPLLFVHR